jgi:hypothetical protein
MRLVIWLAPLVLLGECLAQSVPPASADVRTYGAVCDGVTDDTAAFRSALAAARNVLIPPLTCVVSGVTVPSGGTLRGSGKSATTLLQKAASTGPVISVNSSSQSVELSDFTINGNAAKQTAINPGLASVSSGQPPNGTIYPGAHFTLRNIFVANTTGDCFNLNVGGVNEFHDLSGFRCGGRGAYLQLADSIFSDLDFGSTGQEGIYCDAGCANNRFSNVKVWYTGSASGMAATHGAGLYLQGVRNEFSAVETQNTGGDGVLIYLGADNIISALRSESAGSNASGANTGAVGIRFKNAMHNHVTAYLSNGPCGSSTCSSMRYGIEFDTDGVRATSRANQVSAVVSSPAVGDVLINDGYAAGYNWILITSTSGASRQWGTGASQSVQSQPKRAFLDILRDSPLAAAPTSDASPGATQSDSPLAVVPFAAMSLSAPVGTEDGTVFHSASPIALKFLDLNNVVQTAGCTVLPSFAVYDNDKVTGCVATLANATWGAHAPCNAQIAAGDRVSLRVQSAAAGCTTINGNVFLTLQYQMQ